MKSQYQTNRNPPICAIHMRIPHWGSLRIITHWTCLSPLVLEPVNRPGKSKYYKETTIIVIIINCLNNRRTFKYPLTLRAIVYSQFSNIVNQPLQPQIYIDVENIIVVLNNTVAVTYILLFYMCILHFHQYLHFKKILSPFLAVLQYIEKGENQSCQ